MVCVHNSKEGVKGWGRGLKEREKKEPMLLRRYAYRCGCHNLGGVLASVASGQLVVGRLPRLDPLALARQARGLNQVVDALDAIGLLDRWGWGGCEHGNRGGVSKK